jgi:putative membrane protein
MQSQAGEDPRVYLAAERTFLAWVRTSLALMGFGFVVARFGLFLREITPAAQAHGVGFSLPIGIALIVLGIVVVVSSTFRYRRYIRSIDEGHFRAAFGSYFDITIAAVLAIIGITMAFYLAGV